MTTCRLLKGQSGTNSEMEELERMVELLGRTTLADFNQQLSTTAGEAVHARKARSERAASAGVVMQACTSPQDDGGHEVSEAFDAKFPNSTAEETTPGTPKIIPTTIALFPRTLTPCKGLGTTYGAREDDETTSLGQRANEDDTKGPPGFERSSDWDPGPPTAENPSPEATDTQLIPDCQP